MVLRAEDLEESHPRLPEGWARSMESIKRRGGPWKCSACGGPSYLIYRCSRCGRDLADEGSSTSRQP